VLVAAVVLVLLAQMELTAEQALVTVETAVLELPRL
jgi:hypothetical protein